MYSLAPERMVYERPVGSDKWREQYAQRKAELDIKRAALTVAENILLSQLVLEERGNYSKLNEARDAINAIMRWKSLPSGIALPAN